MDLTETVARAISRRHGYGEFITSLPDAQAAIKAIQDAGYVIVPREPTEAMVEAADNATATKWSDEAYEWEEPGELVTSVFTAMIEAFPTANPSS